MKKSVLHTFMEGLVSVDDSKVLYSKSSNKPIMVIPPDNLIEEDYKEEKIEDKKVVLKFKLDDLEKDLEDTTNFIEEDILNKNIKNDKKPKIDKEELAEQLFIKSCTNREFKTKWLEIYNKALSSKKQDIKIKKMKLGEFMIVEEDHVLFLPKFNISNKDSNSLLKEKWL